MLYHVDGGGSCGVMGEMAHACDNKGGEEKTPFFIMSIMEET